MCFAKLCQFPHDCQKAPRVVARLDAFPRVGGPGDICGRVVQRGKFFRDPTGAASFFKARGQFLVDHAQMRYICQRVTQLCISQWPARPIGESRAFIDTAARQFAHKCFIPDLVAKSANHSGDLGVEQRFGQGAPFDQKNLQILTRGM